MIELGTNTPAWIEAIAAAAAAVAAISGGIWGAYRYFWGGFRPCVKAFRAAMADSLRVTVTNRGRAEGKIRILDIVDVSGARIAVQGAGESFEPLTLSGKDTVELDFNAPANRDFRNDDQVVVVWGDKRERKTATPVAVSFYRKV